MMKFNVQKTLAKLEFVCYYINTTTYVVKNMYDERRGI